MILARRVALVGFLGGTIILFALLGGAAGDRAGGDDSHARIASSPTPASGLPLAAVDRLERRSDLAVRDATGVRDEAILPAAILQLLADIDAAFASENYTELEELLSSLLADPSRLRAVVDRLIASDGTMDAAALRGAWIALEAGIALYERDPGRFGSAGSETIVLLLDALPMFVEELQAPIVRLLQRTRGPTGRALDERFIVKLLELRADHPDLDEALVALLATVAESASTPEHRDSFRRLFLDGEDDPLLVKSALSSLLKEDADTYLWIARELHGRDPANLELRGAITQAIASSAPVDSAIHALSTLTDGTDYAAFLTLSTRSGAEEELAGAYDTLLADGANPEARKMLVSAMARESDEVLLGIARMDPEPTVALQALLNLTGRGPIDTTRLGELRAYYSEGNRLPIGAVMVAENVMVVSSGDARDQARDWLVEMVRDSRLEDAARLDAYGRVRRWVPAGTFAGLAIGGRPLQ